MHRTISQCLGTDRTGLSEALQAMVRDLSAPTYIYDLAGLERDLLEWKSMETELVEANGEMALRLFPTVFSPANRRERVLEVFSRNKFGITVIRNEDRGFARQNGFDDSKIIVSGFGHSFDELDALRETECQVNLASEPELRHWSLSGRPVGVRLDCKRIGQRRSWAFDKLGITLPVLRRLLIETQLQVQGLHYYIGTNASGCKSHIRGLRACLAAAKMTEQILKSDRFYINASGGFPLDRSILRRFLTKANEVLIDSNAQKPVNLYLEMGRAILAPHALFAAPIRHVFKKRKQYFLSMDASISQFPRPARYGFHREFPPFSEDGKHSLVVLDRYGEIVEQIQERNARENVVLAGNSHYSRDILGAVAISDLNRVSDCEGGCVLFANAGAYCESMLDNWLSDQRLQIKYL